MIRDTMDGMAIRGQRVAALLAGCYEPPDSCGITCDTKCPGDLVCSAEHVRVRSDGTGCEAPASPCPSCSGPPPLLAIAARSNHVCAVTEGLQIACWGGNASEQSGVADDNMVLSWGDSWRGAIGAGGSARSVPTPIAGAF
jgi:alpha-tubulin suppressor-like RCC1 family protein